MAANLITSFLVAGLQLAAPHPAAPQAHAPLPYVLTVSGDCSGAASQAVAQTGGELLSAEPSPDGQPVCIVTVLVQENSGRPKKVTMVIPM
jgi:hypothetical protein